jgi:hypothetical protein
MNELMYAQSEKQLFLKLDEASTQQQKSGSLFTITPSYGGSAVKSPDKI